MKFLLFLSCLGILCFTAKGTSPIPRNCVVGDRTLKHGESGPAALGECVLVDCRNGVVSTLMSCGLIKLDPNCPPGVQSPDLTKLYPDCCIPPPC